MRAYPIHLAVNKNKLIPRFIGWYFLVNVVFFWILGWRYLSAILSSATLYENTLADLSSPAGKCVVILFTLVNYFSYMMLLAFLPAIMIFLLAIFVRSVRVIGLTSVILAALSIICLIVDGQIFSMFKFHLNPMVCSFLFNSEWRGFFDFSSYELVLMSGSIAAVFIIEFIVAWLVWTKIIVVERFKTGKTIALFWLVGALFSYIALLITIAQGNNLLSQQTPTLPFYTQLVVHAIPIKNAKNILMRFSEENFSQPLFPNNPLHYPLHTMRCEAPHKPYNIILIMVDALRADGLQTKYMPNVMAFSKKAWTFKNHFSGGNATQPGVFSLFYSIPSNYWTAVLKQKKTPVFVDLLLKYGYATRIIWSMGLYNPPFDKTIYSGLKHLPLDGVLDKDISNWDRGTTKKVVQYLTSRKQNEPFYLHVFYDSPHGFCAHQNIPSPFKPAVEYCSRISLSNDLDPLPYYNRYLNSVKFTDEEIGKVLKTIQKQGYLKNTIVIITSDHGQEFNDNQQNYWGHSGNFTKSQVQVPLVIYWPGEKPMNIEYMTNGYDIIPTLLTRLFSCKNPTADYSIGQNLLQEKGRLPFILAGSYINMGLIEPDRLTTLETSGRVTITDTSAAVLPHAKPRTKRIHQALGLMRRYF